MLGRCGLNKIEFEQVPVTGYLDMLMSFIYLLMKEGGGEIVPPKSL
jgi:hypothetical protein